MGPGDARAPEPRTAALLMALLGLSFWGAFQIMGSAHHGYALGLGSTGFPAYKFIAFASLYALLGGAGAICIAVALTRWGSKARGDELRWFLPLATALGVLIPVLIRLLVMGGGSIADDESVYRFSAELVASGRLSAPSHPYKLFFDHAFLVNDGRMFSQYFLGWPALMALGVPFGATGYVNAVISGASIPALHKLLKMYVGVTWARLGIVVFLAAPMIQLAAASEMSHTSTLTALIYATWFASRALRGGGIGAQFGFGLALAAAFFIRPLSAVAVGLPWALLWAYKQISRRSVLHLAAFAVPAVLLGALFLWINTELTGSPFKTAYQRGFEYGIANAFRFSHVLALRAGGTIMFSLGEPAEMLGMVSAGLLRLNFSLFGWPISFLFLPFAIGAKKAPIWWLTAASYVLTHLTVFDVGIDTFGPTHWFEMALPVLMLTILGCERAANWAERVSAEQAQLPRNLVLACVAASVLLFTPYRSRAVAEIGSMTRMMPNAVDRDGIRNAVIFVNRPWGTTCHPNVIVTPHHFVFWWPVNDPDFENDIIWANHLSVEQDRKLLETFPGRKGYVSWLHRERCEIELVPLEEAAAKGMPNGFMGPHLALSNPYTDAQPITGELPD